MTIFSVSGDSNERINLCQYTVSSASNDSIAKISSVSDDNPTFGSGLNLNFSVSDDSMQKMQILLFGPKGGMNAREAIIFKAAALSRFTNALLALLFCLS